jgi:Tfp pilus assembly protein PilV
MRQSIHRPANYRFDRKNPRIHSDRGFTLLETSIAMVIMMVSVLATASLFAFSIKNNSGANDRELAMAVAQQQIEQLRNVAFTDATLTATAGTTTTVTRAGRQYSVLKIITDSNTINGLPTLKTITTRVTPVGSTLGAVTLRTRRSTMVRGPF